MPDTPLTILYFAWLRERVGTGEERLLLPAGIRTIGALVEYLAARDAGHAAAFENRRTVRCAVNQDFAGPDAAVAPGDEVAFFPPGDGRMTTVRVHAEVFDVGAEIALLTEGRTDIGGIGCFVGTVRATPESPVAALTLEHYPAMTEPALARIAAEATRRWDLLGCTLIHRVGRLFPGEPIVLVLAAAAHRQPALDATSFLIDWLKTRAPFWKKETLAGGAEMWVVARDTDTEAAARWG